jgi:hypothetical protein
LVDFLPERFERTKMREKDMGEEPEKSGGDVHHGGRHRGRHARGGHAKLNVQEYNAKGSHEMEEATDEKDEFAHGGRKKRKAGGMAPGLAAPMRGDKGTRGRAAGGKAQAEKLATGGAALKPAAPKLADGGAAEGREPLARGGRTGNSPWSSGKNLSAPERGKSGNNENAKPGDES